LSNAIRSKEPFKIQSAKREFGLLKQAGLPPAVEKKLTLALPWNQPLDRACAGEAVLLDSKSISDVGGAIWSVSLYEVDACQAQENPQLL